MKGIEEALEDMKVSRRGVKLDWRSRLEQWRVTKLVKAGHWRKLANYALAHAARGLRLEYAPNKPYFLSLDPTDACQLHCPFCIGGGKHGDTFMPYEDYEALLNRLGPWLIKIDFCKGAEPLLHPRICDMIALAHRHGLETVMASNLNNIPDPDRLMSSGLDLLMMSVDGLNQETYGRYRAGGNCEQAFFNMRALVEARKRQKVRSPFLVWNYLVFKYNQHEIPQVVERAKEIGVDSVTFMTPSIPDDPALREDWQSTLPQFRSYGHSSRDPYCIWPWSGLDVRPNGQAGICYGHSDEQVLCSIKELAGNFDSIWNGPKMRGARKGIAANGAPEKPQAALRCCHSCPACGCCNFTV